MGFRLTWLDLNASEEGHYIYRSTSPMDPQNLPTPIATLGPNVGLYDDGNIVEGLTYYYRVGAFSGSAVMVSDEVSAVAAIAAFDPASLFTLGQMGAIFDPYDLSSLYQDTAGTIPVAVHGDPVGLMLDKSGNGFHLSQATAANRPLYQTDGVLRWLLFDGVNDFLSRNAAFMYNAGQISAFLGVSGPAQTDKRILTEGRSTTNTPMYCLQQSGLSGNNGKLTSYIISDTGSALLSQGGVGVAFDNAPHIVGTTDQSGQLKYYVDGVLAESRTYTRATITLDRFCLGALLRTSAAVWYSGKFFGAVIREGVFDETERGNVNAYLANKSGVVL